MPRSTARVLALLELLQSGAARTGAELAERLDVDERTLRRYVEHLRDLDIPVWSVRGRYGGYRLSPGYRLPPLMLTDEEALAVALGLVAGRRAGLLPATVAGAESAAAKLRRVLPDVLRARLDALLEVTDFTAPAREQRVTEAGILLTVAQAARDRRPLDLVHASGRREPSRRVVHPYGVVAHSGRWYLTGADSRSGEVRTFRVDRITTVDVLDGTFEVPAGFDAADVVLSSLARAPHEHEVAIRIEATTEQVRRHLPPSVALLEPVDAEAGWVRARLRVQRLEWIPPLLAALDRPFVIEQPEDLRRLVRELAGRLASYAE